MPPDYSTDALEATSWSLLPPRVAKALKMRNKVYVNKVGIFLLPFGPI
jgi:hypothetical protein